MKPKHKLINLTLVRKHHELKLKIYPLYKTTQSLQMLSNVPHLNVTKSE